MAPNDSEGCVVEAQHGEGSSVSELDSQTACFVGELSGQEGLVLKEHDYFSARGLRERPCARRELDLNMSETELRLGPLPCAPSDAQGKNTQAKAASQDQTFGEKAEEKAASEDVMTFTENFQSGGSQKKEANCSAMHEFAAASKNFPQDQAFDQEKVLHSPAALELDQSRRALIGICPPSKPPYPSPYNVVSGTKRVFVETLGSGFREGRVGFPSPGKFAAIPVAIAKQGELTPNTQPYLPASPLQSQPTSASSFSPWKLGLQAPPFAHSERDKVSSEGEASLWASRTKITLPAKVQSSEVKAKEEATEFQPRAPVGWPPVQSFRKNSLPAAPQSKEKPTPSGAIVDAAVASNAAATDNTQLLLVKVYMDGLPIGRKVDLKVHSSYSKLSFILEEMFRQCLNDFTGSQAAGAGAATKSLTLNEGRNLNFLCGSEYVIAYEDKDGDLMLMGDVPWETFLQMVKRLRIMRACEAIGGLAPQAQKKNKMHTQEVHCN